MKQFSRSNSCHLKNFLNEIRIKWIVFGRNWHITGWFNRPQTFYLNVYCIDDKKSALPHLHVIHMYVSSIVFLGIIFLENSKFRNTFFFFSKGNALPTVFFNMFSIYWGKEGNCSWCWFLLKPHVQKLYFLAAIYIHWKRRWYEFQQKKGR